MLKRAIEKAKVERTKRGIEAMPSLGFRDLKGKCATDMWRAGDPIEKIHLLCGREDKTPTEMYIKQRWRETAGPSMVEMAV